MGGAALQETERSDQDQLARDKKMQAITGSSKSFDSDELEGVYSLSEKDTKINKDISADLDKDSKQSSFKSFINKDAFKGKDYEYKKNNTDKNKVNGIKKHGAGKIRQFTGCQTISCSAEWRHQSGRNGDSGNRISFFKPGGFWGV